LSPLRLCRRRRSVAAYMPKTYSDWLGRQVVLQIEAGESLVPLHGLVVNESNNALRFRLDGGWDVDIFKEMILRVEADNYEASQLRTWEAGNNAPGAARPLWSERRRCGHAPKSCHNGGNGRRGRGASSPTGGRSLACSTSGR
jgi:hypothetical protein